MEIACDGMKKKIMSHWGSNNFDDAAVCNENFNRNGNDYFSIHLAIHDIFLSLCFALESFVSYVRQCHQTIISFLSFA